MPHISGKINKIFNTKYDTPKSFNYQGKTITNTFGHTLYLQGVDGLFNLGDDNSESAYTKSSGELRQGDTIEFMYDENESNGKTYRNIKRATVNKLEAAENVGTVATKAKTSAFKQDTPNPAAVGQVLNLAVYSGASLEELGEFPELARDWVLMVRKAKDNIEAMYNTPEEQNQQDEQAAQSHFHDDNFGDDAPF